MPFLLRKLSRGRWLQYPEKAWLPADDLQADALTDLRTQGNELSVYRIDDSSSNLAQVVAALAANCDYASNIDYALVDHDLVDAIGIKERKCLGELPDERVNANWHVNLSELSASRCLKLATRIAEAGVRRFSKKEVMKWVAESVKSGAIRRDQLKWKDPDHLRSLDELL